MLRVGQATVKAPLNPLQFPEFMPLQFPDNQSMVRMSIHIIVVVSVVGMSGMLLIPLAVNILHRVIGPLMLMRNLRHLHRCRTC